MSDCLFCKFVAREIVPDVVAESEHSLAFRDINPQAPTHILIIPNKLIPTVNDITPEDEPMLGRLFTVAKLVAEQEGIAESGYRLLVNCLGDAGQEVFHLHMHIFGGRPLGPMLTKRG
mgnify:CR=1 FL=1